MSIATKPGTISRHALTCLLALALVRPLGAQTPEHNPPQQSRSLTQYAYDLWDDRNGLPQNSVQAIAQSSDGYLWLGTQLGLARFDGVRFQVFDASNTPALRRAYVWALEADRQGGLWIGSEEGGLVHSSGGKFTAYGKKDGLDTEFVTRLKLDRAGNLWIGTMGDGLKVRRPNGRFESVDSTKFPRKTVLAMAEDTGGIVWIGTPKGVARMRGGDIKMMMLTDKPGMGGSVHSLVARPGGGVYAAAGGAGVALIQGDDVQFITPPEKLPSPYVQTLALDEHGAVWAGTANGLARIANGEVSTFPPGTGPENGVVAMHNDSEGSLWLGLDAGGLARMRPTPIVPIGKAEGLGSDIIFPIMQARNGDVWVGTSTTGVDVLRAGKRIATYNAQQGHLSMNSVASLTEDRDGTVWVGTFNGLSAIRDGKAKLYKPADGLLPGSVRALKQDRSGALWLGTQVGLQRFLGGERRTYTTKDGLADNWVMTMMEDRKGTLWVATRRGLSRKQGDRFETFSVANGMPDQPIMAMHEDADGVIWLATNEGLMRFVNNRFTSFSRAQGLCADGNMSVLEDDKGNLWLGSNRGIMRVEKAPLAKGIIKCKLYDRAAGMRASETNGAVNPAAVRAQDGRMWFPTIRGIAVVDPNNVKLDLIVPPVHIEEVIADGTRYASMPERLPAGVRTLEIRFTALSFVAPEQMRFRYKLDGYDKDWVDAGARRAAFYTELRPRTYTFHVQAANADGQWNTVGVTAKFAVAPYWWQTWSFRGAVAVVVLGILWLLYRMRIQALNRRQNELLALADERGRAEARYRELFENATDAVFTTDINGNFTALNRKALELTGYSEDEALTLNIRSLLPNSPAGERVVRQWLRGDADGSERVDIICADSGRVPVEVSTRRITEGNVVLGIQAVARDVTDRAALERQLRQSQKMEAVGQLAGGVAHDFNNLLTVIRGNGELILQELSEDDPNRGDVEQINLAAERASALTRQLLAFSRKTVVHPRPLDLNSLLREIEKMLQRLIGEDFTIVTRTSSEPACVLADPSQLEQVLVNLVVNARDAMPKGGSITIETSIMEVEDVPQSPVRTNSGRAVVLTVSDSGKGMDAATQARIFEPFFTTKDPGKGTGLGLSTVYGIVQQAGGQIDCATRPGKGTTFRIYLPFTHEAEVAVPSDQNMQAQRGSETILLVEDQDAVRTLAVRVLRHHGYNVLEAKDGPDAIAVSNDYPGHIDLVLTDVVMPNMNGRVLSERLIHNRPDLRIMLMSGYNEDEVVRRGLLEPGVAYLQKPFTPNSLLRAVRQVLDSELGAAAD